VVIAPGTRLRLAPKARLRFDARSGRQVLLYPEQGLELSDTAARIVALCGEERTAGGIVAEMTAAAADAVEAADVAPPPAPIARERIEREVLAFLQALADRGLLVVSEP
jgi:hypothetical protein